MFVLSLLCVCAIRFYFCLVFFLIKLLIMHFLTLGIVPEDTPGNNWYKVVQWALGVVVGLAIILTLVLLPIFSTQEKEDCDSVCQEQLKMMVQRMNKNADICDDPFEYGNGGFDNQSIPEGRIIWGTLEEINWQNFLAINASFGKMGIYHNSHQIYTKHVYTKSSRFFKACMDEDKIAREGGKPALTLIEALGGWELLPGTVGHVDWDNEKFLHVTRTKLSTNIFLAWDVIKDERSNIMVLEAVNHRVLKNWARNAELALLLRMCVLLGAEETAARSMLMKVSVLQSAFAKSATSSENGQKKDVYSTIEELNDLLVNNYEAPLVKNWTSFLNKEIDPKEQVLGSDKILVRDVERIEKILKIIDSYSKTDEGRSILRSYMMWEILPSVTSYLSKPFRDLSEMLINVRLGMRPRDDDDRLTYCVERTHSVLREPVDAMFGIIRFRDENKKEVEMMSSYIRNSMKQFFHWMVDSDRKIIEAEIEGFKQLIGEKTLSKQELKKLNERYDGLTVTSSYFDNEIDNNVFIYNSTLKSLKLSVNIINTYDVGQLDTNAYFDRVKKEALFPVGIIQLPLISYRMPEWFNYAGFGVVISHEFGHGVERSIKTDSSYTSATIEEFKNFRECLQNQNPSGRIPTNEDIADINAYPISYNAFLEAEKNSKVYVIPALEEYTANQLYHIKYIQSQFRIINVPNIKGAHTFGREKVEMVLRNDDNFAKDNNCPVGSRMNPVVKCQLGQRQKLHP